MKEKLLSWNWFSNEIHKSWMVMGRVKVLDRKEMKLKLLVSLLFVVVGHREVDTWGSSHHKLQAKHVCQNRHRGSRLTIGGAYKQQLEGRYHIHPDYTSHNGCEYKFHMLLLPVSLCVILLHAPKQKSSKVWVYKFTGVVIVVLSPSLSLSLSPASIWRRRRRRRVRVSSLNCCCQCQRKMFDDDHYGAFQVFVAQILQILLWMKKMKCKAMISWELLFTQNEEV